MKITMDTEIEILGSRDQVLPAWYARAGRGGADRWAHSAAGPLLNTYTRPVRGWVVSREYLIRYVANQVQGERGVLEEYLTEVLLHLPARRLPEMANADLPCHTVCRTVLQLARRYGAPEAEHLARVLMDQRQAGERTGFPGTRNR